MQALTPTEQHLRDWYGDLGSDRAGRAALRRCTTIDEVLLSGPGAQAFARLRQLVPTRSREMEGLARAALAAAEVDENSGGTGRGEFGQRCGAGAVSENRFRLLMSAEDPDDFLRLLRSAIVQLERRAPLSEVFWLARLWHSPDHRAPSRRDQLLAFYGAWSPKRPDER